MHGGPGNPMSYLTYHYQSRLESDYTLVHWDQRGSGRTYYENKKHFDIPTFETLLLDMDELVDYLLKRFQKEKVIILAHSWGTVLSREYVNLRNNKVESYVSVSQVVNVIEGTKIMAKLALDKARSVNKKDAIKISRLIDIVCNIDNFDIRLMDEYVKLRMLIVKYLNYEKQRSFLTNIWCGITSPEFSYRDFKWYVMSILNIGKFAKVQESLIEYCFNFDIFKHSAEYNVPVSFLASVNDCVTPAVLIKEYFKSIKAPDKKIIVFNDTGHSPHLETPDKFCLAIKELLS